MLDVFYDLMFLKINDHGVLNGTKWVCNTLLLNGISKKNFTKVVQWEWNNFFFVFVFKTHKSYKNISLNGIIYFNFLKKHLMMNYATYFWLGDAKFMLQLLNCYIYSCSYDYYLYYMLISLHELVNKYTSWYNCVFNTNFLSITINRNWDTKTGLS